MKKLKAALLVDNMSLAKWQFDALKNADHKLDVTYILNCTNTKTKKSVFKNFLYYILNIISLRNKLSKIIPLEGYKRAKVINFKSLYKKNWQSIPRNISQELISNDIYIIIKYGMSLLTIDDQLAQLNIFSFHHGDPSKYRGRPAGFYEILNGEKKSGIIVQSINNKLDGGEVYAFAESKIINYSYKKTAINFYSHSKFLLSKAIDNLNNSRQICISKEGKNYRLPSNPIVISFIKKILFNFIRRIIYGIFYEKRWKVGMMQNRLSLNGEELISSNSLKEIPIQGSYNFYADPFFSTDDNFIRLEALKNKTGLGDILEISLNGSFEQKVILDGKHYSYPYSFIFQNSEYLLPEVASHSPQYFIKLSQNIETKIPIKGLEKQRIVDATLVEKENNWYLFFSYNNDTNNVLYLWTANTPYEVFSPHPESPINLMPSQSRMGGGVIQINGRLLRFGQNNEGEYGESISVMEIKELTPSKYQEVKCGSIEIDNFKGPHSINFNSNCTKLTIDYYENKFSLLAGIRRLLAKLVEN